MKTDERPLLEESLRGGQMWSRVLKRGQRLRLTDLEGGACVPALFFNADMPIERYNMPDTLKAQHVARLTAGNVLYSDMGRVLCAIVEDTCGWHDTISGIQDAAQSLEKFGEGPYQTLRNDRVRNTRDNFLVELGKYELGKRDLPASVNFFVKLRASDEGALAWVADNSRAGAFVELESEMNTLVVLSNTPHPLDPAKSYAPRPVRLTVFAGSPGARAGAARASCPQNERGFQLTDSYFA
jgi:urea carboxylase-associated protein 2